MERFLTVSQESSDGRILADATGTDSEDEFTELDKEVTEVDDLPTAPAVKQKSLAPAASSSSIDDMASADEGTHSSLESSAEIEHLKEEEEEEEEEEKENGESRSDENASREKSSQGFFSYLWSFISRKGSTATPQKDEPEPATDSGILPEDRPVDGSADSSPIIPEKESLSTTEPTLKDQSPQQEAPTSKAEPKSPREKVDETKPTPTTSTTVVEAKSFEETRTTPAHVPPGQLDGSSYQMPPPAQYHYGHMPPHAPGYMPYPYYYTPSGIPPPNVNVPYTQPAYQPYPHPGVAPYLNQMPYPYQSPAYHYPPQYPPQHPYGVPDAHSLPWPSMPTQGMPSASQQPYPSQGIPHTMPSPQNPVAPSANPTPDAAVGPAPPPPIMKSEKTEKEKEKWLQDVEELIGKSNESDEDKAKAIRHWKAVYLTKRERAQDIRTYFSPLLSSFPSKYGYIDSIVDFWIDWIKKGCQKLLYTPTEKKRWTDDEAELIVDMELLWWEEQCNQETLDENRAGLSDGRKANVLKLLKEKEKNDKISGHQDMLKLAAEKQKRKLEQRNPEEQEKEHNTSASSSEKAETSDAMVATSEDTLPSPQPSVDDSEVPEIQDQSCSKPESDSLAPEIAV